MANRLMSWRDAMDDAAVTAWLVRGCADRVCPIGRHEVSLFQRRTSRMGYIVEIRACCLRLLNAAWRIVS